jgi:hypothetical protein
MFAYAICKITWNEITRTRHVCVLSYFISKSNQKFQLNIISEIFSWIFGSNFSVFIPIGITYNLVHTDLQLSRNKTGLDILVDTFLTVTKWKEWEFCNSSCVCFPVFNYLENRKNYRKVHWTKMCFYFLLNVCSKHPHFVYICIYIYTLKPVCKTYGCWARRKACVIYYTLFVTFVQFQRILIWVA